MAAGAGACGGLVGTPGCQISVTLMSWDGWWVDLGLFTTQFSDKVLLDTWI